MILQSARTNLQFLSIGCRSSARFVSSGACLSLSCSCSITHTLTSSSFAGLDASSEKDLALTPCAHEFCAECILSCLNSTSSSREPSGTCPECREKFNRSEITFLGDASEARKQSCRTVENDQKPKAIESSVDINGFHLSTSDKLVVASGAADRRSAYSPLDVEQKRIQQVNLHTLPAEFLKTWNEGYNQIGTKAARLLEEIKNMIVKDNTSKAVVFSQYLGTLDIVSEELARRGVKFARVDAMMKQHQRADSLISITIDPSTKVLLLSMKAGAAGLNLVVANVSAFSLFVLLACC